jgi:hypothetical protein
MRFDASGVPTLAPERIPFEWKRDTLCFILSGACPYRKTGVHFSGTGASGRVKGKQTIIGKDASV